MTESNSEDNDISKNLPKSWKNKKLKPAKSYASQKVSGGDRESLEGRPQIKGTSTSKPKKATSYSKSGKTREDVIDKKDL